MLYLDSYHFVYIPVCVCLSLQSILSASISSHSINITIPSYTVLSCTIIKLIVVIMQQMYTRELPNQKALFCGHQLLVSGIWCATDQQLVTKL